MSNRPRIGMDRYIDAAWMSLAAEVLRGEAGKVDLEARLALDISGIEVRQKVTGILNRMWFSADSDLSRLAVRAASLIADEGEQSAPASFSAVAVAAYPYFSQVLEVMGRIVKVQDSFSSGEVHRRMFERHGKRTTVDQATSYTFKTLGSWGMLERDADRKVLRPKQQLLTPGGMLLLTESAAIWRQGPRSLSIGDPLLFAFYRSQRQ